LQAAFGDAESELIGHGIPLSDWVAGGLRRRERLGEATDGAFVADEAVSLDLDAKQDRVVVAVSGCGDDAQAVAAGFAFHPELLAGAAPEGDEACLQRLGVADGIEKAEHQHFAGARILHDAGARPSIFSKSTHSMGLHLSFKFAQRKKPAGLIAGGLGNSSIWMAV